MLPDPATLVSSLLGFPLYSISPDPDTRAFKLSLLTTSASPDPAIETTVWLDCKPKPCISPEPANLAVRLFVLPFNVRSPEPAKLPLTEDASTFKTTSPDPANDTSRLVAVIVSSFHKSPEPASDTLEISLKGIVILIVLFQLGLKLIFFSTFIIKLLPLISVIIYSNRFFRLQA